jgi:hypothetical protein
MAGRDEPGSPERSAQPAASRSSEDCLGCRITGAVFGVGGAAYLASPLLLADTPPRGAHRAGILIAASCALAVGLYRALGP